MQASSVTPSAGRQLSPEEYARAERLLPANAGRLVFGLGVEPHWIDGGDRFWYRSEARDGHRYFLVDPGRGTREPAFDQAGLAAALSAVTGEPYTPDGLPFDAIDLADDGTVVIDVAARRWLYDPETGACRAVERPPATTDAEVVSPDGRRVAFARDHHLYLRSVETGQEVALTGDGEPGLDYATPLPSPLAGAGIEGPGWPVALTAIWSPDSRRVLSYRTDSRGAGQYHLVQSVPLNGSTRPVLHSYAYPLPGDEPVPMAELWVFDVEDSGARAVQEIRLPSLYYGSPIRPEWVWWDDGGDQVYVLARGRGFRTLTLWAVDARTGAARVLVHEEGSTPIDAHLTHSAGRPNVRVVDHGAKVLWFSQRDGWGHLYLFDGASGQLVRQVTSGAWAVAEICFVDEVGRWVYFTAVGREQGRDPYFELLYRVSLDGGEPTLLTPEDATHLVTFSPSGTVLVDTYSRVDLPPISVLRSADGMLLQELERADIEPLLEVGWQPPERFVVKARDGETDIYGVLFRPSSFDPEQGPEWRLPILDDIYAGPQTNRAPTSFAGCAAANPRAGWNRTLINRGFWQAVAMAELGFAVVMIDGLGMPYRAKALHDLSYRRLGDGGIEDHVHGIRQLAERYPYLDTDRVGIYGHSAGGYASAHAILAFPDFYKVCVSSAGNHVHQLDKASWIERYMGLPVGDHYVEQANSALAHRLAGKLLLIHGEMDENVHVASTMQLVDALVKANKDFDLLILPNRPHGCTEDPYFVRRRWDYFVRHLLGAEPPAGYQIGARLAD